MLLLSEMASFSQTGFSTGWSAQDHVTSGANRSYLRVGKYSLNIPTVQMYQQKVTSQTLIL